MGLVSHPLIYHCLDVAAVFEAILNSDELLRQFFSTAFKTSFSELLDPLLTLVMLHDIGKTGKQFQAKSIEAWPTSLGERPDSVPFDHAEAGAQLLLNKKIRHVISTLMTKLSFEASSALIYCSVYHHGAPRDRHPVGSTTLAWGDEFNAQIVAREIISFRNPNNLSFPLLSTEPARIISWKLSGLINLSDWIGSDTNFFPYYPPDFSLLYYWSEIAQPAASKAIQHLKLTPQKINSSASYESTFHITPSPAQQQCHNLMLPKGPILVIIEDQTGSGKTENATMLAHRMLMEGKGKGIFVALPTMATTNAMYNRMSDAYRVLFDEDSSPSLALAHGRSKLNRHFSETIVPIGGVSRTVAECSSFFADDRRKALLADVGVGTIDQILLSVLPTKFATLRLYGISSKILIIDEAHAYDDYMSRELERLLSFHSSLGGSVIILSATLPKKTKEKLSKAFCGGLHTNSINFSHNEYPLATTISKGLNPCEIPLTGRSELSRRISVSRINGPEKALNRIIQAVKLGACVAYIRNTVDDAIETFQELQSYGIDVKLFHARFAMSDRRSIEEEVIATFGKSSLPEMRRGKVIVATQVIEQSLDIDLDLMVTDLAPIDLLIQRAGRLWRHIRPERSLNDPEFLVVSPDPILDADEKWFRRMFNRASYVYSAHALLWLTAKVLFDAGCIDAPNGIRNLIECVYGSNARDKIPVGLIKNFDIEEGNAFGDISHADNNLLNVEDGYEPGHRGWSKDVYTPTRLGEEQTPLRLALWDGSKLSPYAGGNGSMSDWLLSEISVTRRRVSGRGSYDPLIEEAARYIEAQWRENGDNAVLIPLLGDSRWEIQLFKKSNNNGNEFIKANYDRDTGLCFVK